MKVRGRGLIGTLGGLGGLAALGSTGESNMQLQERSTDGSVRRRPFCRSSLREQRLQLLPQAARGFRKGNRANSARRFGRLWARRALHTERRSRNGPSQLLDGLCKLSDCVITSCLRICASLRRRLVAAASPAPPGKGSSDGLTGHTVLTPGTDSGRKGREERRMADRRHADQRTPGTRHRKRNRVASEILVSPARRAAEAVMPRRRCTAELNAIRSPSERLTRRGQGREAEAGAP